MSTPSVHHSASAHLSLSCAPCVVTLSPCSHYFKPLSPLPDFYVEKIPAGPLSEASLVLVDGRINSSFSSFESLIRWSPATLCTLIFKYTHCALCDWTSGPLYSFLCVFVPFAALAGHPPPDPWLQSIFLFYPECRMCSRPHLGISLGAGAPGALSWTACVSAIVYSVCPFHPCLMTSLLRSWS